MKIITSEYAPLQPTTQKMDDDAIVGWVTKDGFVPHPDFETRKIDSVIEVEDEEPYNMPPDGRTGW